MQRSEEALQKAAAQFLDMALPEKAVWWHTPNQRGTRRKWENELLKSFGVRTGFPDIAILWNGKLHLIELKAKGRGLSSAQKELRPRLRDAGAVVLTCRSLEEMETIMDLWNIPLRARLKGKAA